MHALPKKSVILIAMLSLFMSHVVAAAPEATENAQKPASSSTIAAQAQMLFNH